MGVMRRVAHENRVFRLDTEFLASEQRGFGSRFRSCHIAGANSGSDGIAGGKSFEEPLEFLVVAAGDERHAAPGSLEGSQRIDRGFEPPFEVNVVSVSRNRVSDSILEFGIGDGPLGEHGMLHDQGGPDRLHEIGLRRTESIEVLDGVGQALQDHVQTVDQRSIHVEKSGVESAGIERGVHR